MTLSNNADAVARFWRKYGKSLMNSGVKDHAVKWYLRHAEAYLNAHPTRKLATHSKADVDAWLSGLGRIGRMEAWQFRQAVDAVRHLFIVAQAPAVDTVDWGFWRDGSADLPENHPTLARRLEPPRASARDGGDAGAGHDAVSRLVAVIRQRNYSIRTEEAYRGWLQRFLAFIGGGDPCNAGAAEVRRFLETLAVEGRVAGEHAESGAQRTGVLLRQGA